MAEPVKSYIPKVVHTFFFLFNILFLNISKKNRKHKLNIHLDIHHTQSHRKMAEQHYFALSSTGVYRVRVVRVWDFSFHPFLPLWSVGMLQYSSRQREAAVAHETLLVRCSNWAVALLCHAGQAAGAKPGFYPLSKTCGGDGKSGRGRRRKVEELQDSDSNAATPREHAWRRHPLVATRVVFFYGIETRAAIIASNRV